MGPVVPPKFYPLWNRQAKRRDASSVPSAPASPRATCAGW